MVFSLYPNPMAVNVSSSMVVPPMPSSLNLRMLIFLLQNFFVVFLLLILLPTTVHPFGLQKVISLISSTVFVFHVGCGRTSLSHPSWRVMSVYRVITVFGHV